MFLCALYKGSELVETCGVGIRESDPKKAQACFAELVQAAKNDGMWLSITYPEQYQSTLH